MAQATLAESKPWAAQTPVVPVVPAEEPVVVPAELLVPVVCAPVVELVEAAPVVPGEPDDPAELLEAVTAPWLLPEVPELPPAPLGPPEPPLVPVEAAVLLPFLAVVEGPQATRPTSTTAEINADRMCHLAEAT